MAHDVRMDRTAGATLRRTRAGLLTAVAMVSGTIAHRSAGGILPGPVALIVLFVVATALVAPLLARPATTLRVVVLMMAGQTFVHGSLTALSGHRGDPPLPRGAPTLSYTPPVPVQHVGSLGVVARIAALTRSLRVFPPDLAIGRLPRRSQVLERIVVRRGPPPAAA